MTFSFFLCAPRMDLDFSRHLLCVWARVGVFLPFLGTWASPNFLIDFDRHLNYSQGSTLVIGIGMNSDIGIGMI